jgi:hypothetical protein
MFSQRSLIKINSLKLEIGTYLLSFFLSDQFAIQVPDPHHNDTKNVGKDSIRHRYVV